MKKQLKRLMTAALTGAMVLSLTVPALATITDPKDADVEFTPNTSPGAFQFEGGAPALDFGTHTLVLGDMWYDEVTPAGVELAVKDGRGTGVGWKVTASLSDFAGTTVPTRKLDGAKITFQDATLTRVSDGGSEDPVVPNSGVVTLTVGAAAIEFWKAEDAGATNPQGAGTGTSTLEWAAAGGTGEHTSAPATGSGSTIFLYVKDGTAMADKYKATINWSLDDTP